MKDWKTTLTGILGAALLLGYKAYFHTIELPDITTALTLLGIGAAAKDSTTHSTQSEVAESTVEVQQKNLEAAQK